MADRQSVKTRSRTSLWVGLRSILAPIWRPIRQRLTFNGNRARLPASEPSVQELDRLVELRAPDTIAKPGPAPADKWRAWGKAAGRIEHHINTYASIRSSIDKPQDKPQGGLNDLVTPGLHLHSVLLAPDGRELVETDLPFRLQSNLASFRQLYPTFTWRLWQQEDLVGFLEAAFDQDVTKAFHGLVPMAYKTDLARYCLLYQFGGIYSDVSIQHFFPLFEESPEALYLFRDGFSQVPWLVSNSIVGAPAGHPLFERLILRIIEHVKGQYYGVNPLCPTGPNLFGRELALHVSAREIRLGETIRINKNPETFSWGYLDGSGELVAVNAKRGAGLASLGFAQQQDYNEMYWQSRIYRSFEDV